MTILKQIEIKKVRKDHHCNACEWLTNGGVTHHWGYSGHSLVYRTDLTYPSCYAECVDAFLLNRVAGNIGWDVQYSFDGKSESGSQYVSVDRIKDIYGGKVHV